TVAAPVEIDTSFLGETTVDVLTTQNTLDVQGYGPARVNLGDRGSVQGIHGEGTIENTLGSDDVTADDSADEGQRVGTFDDDPARGGLGRITGLAPAAIDYRYGGNGSVNVRTGTGGNTLNVTATGTPLTITTRGEDTVNVGQGGSVQNVKGKVRIEGNSGSVVLDVNDSADAQARKVQTTEAALISLAPGEIGCTR